MKEVDREEKDPKQGRKGASKVNRVNNVFKTLFVNSRVLGTGELDTARAGGEQPSTDEPALPSCQNPPPTPPPPGIVEG